ncbi:hypothetical protein [Streptomyces marincola]|uniref:hypothetical protein n=1 Tax=Streptomyces marincola TaxID=2878388 RepID=UPI001CF5C146|nr:hypothetical protein [Streptomyces marincola]UCM90526.1 hypothetical protein LC193_22760 [Streptomyces marincola]
MNQASKAAFAAGIAGGYLMGRRKRAKVAFAVATYAIGRRFPLGPRKLAGEGVRRLREHPQFSELGGRLGDAGRTAASGAVAQRIESLTSAVEERTHALTGPPAREDGAREDTAQAPPDERAGPRDRAGERAERPAKHAKSRNGGGRR